MDHYVNRIANSSSLDLGGLFCQYSMRLPDTLLPYYCPMEVEYLVFDHAGNAVPFCKYHIQLARGKKMKLGNA